jgi:hypothetical protein
MLSRGVHTEARLVCHLFSVPHEHKLLVFDLVRLCISSGKERISVTSSCSGKVEGGPFSVLSV